MNCVTWMGGSGGGSSSGVQAVNAGDGITVTGTNSVVVSNAGVIDVTSTNAGINVDNTDPQHITLTSNAVLTVDVSGSGLTRTQDNGAVVLMNTGTVSVTGGTGITTNTINGNVTVTNSLPGWNMNFIINEFNGDPNVSNTTTGSAAAVIPIPETAGVLPMTNGLKYQVTITCAVTSTAPSVGGSWMGVYVERVDNNGNEYGPAMPIINVPESTQSTAISTTLNIYALPPAGGGTCAGVVFKVLGDALVGTATATIYQLTSQVLN